MRLFTRISQPEDEEQPVLQEFNQKRATENKVPINIGIGIASGTVMAGYAGTQHRATYTCVGDLVNLEVRIESHTKIVGCPVLIDAETRASLPESLSVDPLGEVIFKGKTIPVQIYSVRPG